jgi:hypothetical protein
VTNEPPSGREPGAQPVIPEAQVGGSLAGPGNGEPGILSEAAGRAPRLQPRRNFLATSDNFFISWGRAIVLGVRDTAEDMLDEGRAGAREAFDEGWEKFDAKTRYRRAQPHKRSRRGKRG